MQKIKDFFKSCPEVINLILFLLGGVLLVFLTNNFFGVFAPFIIAFVIVKILRPLMVKIEKHIKLPRIVTTLLCLIIFAIVAALVVWFVLFNVISGIEYVINIVSTNASINNISEQMLAIEEKVTGWGTVFNVEIDFNQITEYIYDFAKTLITNLSSLSLKIVLSIPSLVISAIIGCLAAFYMLYDYDKISAFIARQLSPKTKSILDVLNQDVFVSLIKMIFAYILISLVCFIELGVGFWVLEIKDAWFIAFIIAVIDVFPIVGSGGILVPWSIIAFCVGDPFRGVGLLVLWGVIVVVRQIIEPKIVGSQLGLHSLLTIMALYLGLELMGGVGLIVGPLYVIACKKINESGVINIYK